MGMLDRVELIPLPDKYKNGEPMRVLDAKIGPTINTEYGEAYPVLLTVDEQPEPATYCVYGDGLLSQVGNMDDSDRRNMSAGKFVIRIEVQEPKRAGRSGVKLFVPAELDDAPSF